MQLYLRIIENSDLQLISCLSTNCLSRKWTVSGTIKIPSFLISASERSQTESTKTSVFDINPPCITPSFFHIYRG